MDLTQSVDIYCERVGPAFWAEPVNALSNLAFLLAGAAALWLARRENRIDDLPVLLLSTLTIAVGIGSFLFHTVAKTWAGIADVAPIILFILGYFAAALNRFAGLSWLWAGLAAAGFIVVSPIIAAGLGTVLGSELGASRGYFPALIALFAIGLWLDRGHRHRAGRALITAAVAFAVSLTLRTLDAPLCTAIPLGTHFLWHLLNGLVLWLLLRALIRHGRAPAVSPAR